MERASKPNTKNQSRATTRKIRIGSVVIGGGLPVRVQSMTKTDTRDVKSTVTQIKQLEEVGCEIIRCAVPDNEAVISLGKIKKQIKIPLVADIHFDYRLALESICQGVDKIRINPGNIGSDERLKQVVLAAKERGIPIRIGVNAGSLKVTPSHLPLVKGERKKGYITKSQTMVSNVTEYVRKFEHWGFEDIVISVKASDVLTTLTVYREIAKKVRYPLHLGVTESGSYESGTIKSTLGIGILLAEGIGDTIRVSLTASPEDEVRVGYEILRDLGLRKGGIELISCPTCGRCEVDLIRIVNELEKKLFSLSHRFEYQPLKVAVMGCVVNGPGEAKDADIGIAAGGKNVGLLFRHGKPVKKLPPSQWANTLFNEIHKIRKNND